MKKNEKTKKVLTRKELKKSAIVQTCLFALWTFFFFRHLFWAEEQVFRIVLSGLLVVLCALSAIELWVQYKNAEPPEENEVQWEDFPHYTPGE